MLPKHCTYTQTSDGVHIFYFEETSLQAVDEWYTQINQIIREQGTMPKVIVDVSRGTPPIMAFIGKMREFLRRNMFTEQTRAALIYRSGTGLLSPLRSLVESVTHGRSKLQVRFFTQHEKEQAYNWLLE